MTSRGESAPGRSAGAGMAWLVWGLGAVVFGCAFFQRVAPGVMVDGLMAEYAVGGAVLGNLTALYFWTYALMQVPAGLIVDAFGCRRILIASGLLCALGSFAFAFAPNLGIAYAGRLLIGVGAGSTFIISLTLGAVWFEVRRLPLISGLTFTAGTIGSLVGQAPLAWGVDAWGWRPPMAAAAWFVLATCVAAWVFVRNRPSDGGRAVGRTDGLGARFLSVLVNPQAWVLSLVAAGLVAVLLVFGGLWAVPYLMHIHGLGRADAAALNSLGLIAWGVGSPLIGWLAGRLGRRKGLLVFAAVVNVGSFAALALLPDLPLFLVGLLLVIQGLASSGIALIFALAHGIFVGGREGMSAGVVNTLAMMGAAAMQPLVGWVLDLNWRGVMAGGARVYDAEAYQVAFSVLIAAAAVAVVAALFVREPDGRGG